MWLSVYHLLGVGLIFLFSTTTIGHESAACMTVRGAARSCTLLGSKAICNLSTGVKHEYGVLYCYIILLI